MWLRAAAFLLLATLAPTQCVQCTGEIEVQSDSAGNIVVNGTETSSSECSVLIRPTGFGAQGITLSLSPAGAGCPDSPPFEAIVYDGTTPLAPMLTKLACQGDVRVSSSSNALLIVTRFAGGANLAFLSAAGWSGSWSPAEGQCGNGVCEPSFDEYSTCAADCEAFGAQLPLIADQWNDMSWCGDEFDTFDAVASNGERRAVQFTTAHFGRRIPLHALAYRLGVALELKSASDDASTCDEGAAVPAGHCLAPVCTSADDIRVAAWTGAAAAAPVEGNATLASIFHCHVRSESRAALSWSGD